MFSFAKIVRPRASSRSADVRPVSVEHVAFKKWVYIDLVDTLFSPAMSQMCITALANLHRAALKDNKPKQLFSKDQDILPYIEQHWEAMTTMPRRVTQSWYDWNCLFELKIAV